MIEGAKGRSAKAELVTYPGAYHAFDHPSLPLRERTGLAFTANDNGRAHIGTDQAARADAIKRVAEWLAR
jgi:dienelactone hydrolase